MVPRVLTLVVCFLLQAIARAYTAQVPFRTTEDENGCPTGIHVVGVRGTLEKPGFGAMQPLVDKLLADIPDSDSFAIDYPAAGIIIEDDKPIYQPLEYIHSVKAGRKKLSAELIDFTSSCPNTSIGAQVAGDVLCGSTFPFFGWWRAMEDEDKANIKAFVTLGDPRNNRGTPVHAGSSTKDGLFVRMRFKNCGANTISSWRTYCDANDTFCDHGESIEAHLRYVPKYFDDIIGFIKGKLAK
ncbi:Cutinase [Lasallia pustulata]|uniref:Cutinase n=1 Tax=Lasallia pustulata TaxID=136370 RepID=A0A1W5D9X3_9LECA|nr:Cutinase [Lasallia pustulata]